MTKHATVLVVEHHWDVYIDVYPQEDLGYDSYLSTI